MNYELVTSNKNDIDLLVKYKKASIIDYADNLSRDEINKINNYVINNVSDNLDKYFNIVVDNNIVGALLVTDIRNGKLLDDIYLEEEYRGKGIGSSIINNLIEEYKNSNLYLWVYKNNAKAINLYKKLGFKIKDETETRYYMVFDLKNNFDNIKTPEQLLDFMSDNIIYGYKNKFGEVVVGVDNNWFNDYVLQSGEELLKSLHGTCWDQVELARDWFTKNNYEVKTIYEMVLVDYENDYSTHSYLIYKDKDKYCYFENADELNRGIYKFDSYEEAIDFQFSLYTSELNEKEKGKVILREFDKPYSHINAEEYIEFAINSKVIK